MKIALAQINTTTGDVRGNLRLALRQVERAEAEGADLLVLPAWALSGWQPQDLALDGEFLNLQNEALDRLESASEAVPIVAGYARPTCLGDCVPTVALFAGGESAASLDPESEPVVSADLPGGTLSLLDPDSLSWEGVGRDADVAVMPGAEPYRRGGTEERRHLLGRVTDDLSVPLVWTNLVGGNGELVFDGGSRVLDARGELMAAAAAFEEGTLLVDLELGQPSEAAEETGEISRLYAALRLGLGDFVRKTGFEDAVLGLSGGIDSAVVAALAADALGPEHVMALLMPTRFSSEESRMAAETVAENLGIEARTMSIERLRIAFDEALLPIFRGTDQGVAEENIQARIRGTVLMAYASKFNAMPLATGNRSEIAVGYCTLYGDMTGGLAAVGCVPKADIYRLAHHINREREIIPQSVISAPPSAELRPDQTDQDDLPPYEVLDEILALRLDQGRDADAICARGYNEGLVAEVLGRLKRADFKRRQAAPMLRVGPPGARWPRLPLGAKLVHMPSESEETHG